MRGPAQIEAAKLARVSAVSKLIGRPVENVQTLATGRYTAHIPHLGEEINKRVRAIDVSVEDIPTETGGRRDDVRRIEFDSDAPVWRFLSAARLVEKLSIAAILLAGLLALALRFLVKA